ncbi:capsular exopolysaccharide family [Tistlia consotensis]|uniref:Capsular exopolysaccharide family n=1 Tax=Tistlia consotensis USBA 355 TaxID=560819 RepID=A0A1Y6CG15_9PROT|nr:polysaccharide biosynthesis tyrosine autokinase [Tistlia consotensis]SMF63049.1 capsular exopolysaccharide family [Tistlia consotensis USBA 355]SNR95453.1 capsular exopolysaccharide family [Tistlia consotensis]
MSAEPYNVTPEHEPASRLPPAAPGGLQQAPRPQGGGGFDLRSLLGIVRRRKFMILGICLIASALSLVFVNRLTPLYRTGATILIEGKTTNFTNQPQAVESIARDYYTVQAEAVVLTSLPLAEKAVLALKLQTNPLFNRALSPPRKSLFADLKTKLQAFLAEHGLMEAPTEPVFTPPETIPDPADDPAYLRQLANAFRGALRAQPDTNTGTITLSYVSTDPVFAAKAVNTVASLYVDSLESERAGKLGQGIEFFQEQVAEAEDRVRKARTALEDFNRDNNIQELDGRSLDMRRLDSLAGDLREAETRMNQLQQDYGQVQRALKGPDLVDSSAGLSNPTVSNVRLSIINAERQLAELLNQYREGHPKVQALRAEIDRLRTSLRNQLTGIASDLGGQLAVARQDVAGMKEERSKLEDRLQTVSRLKVARDTLQNALDDAEQLLRERRRRLDEVALQRQAPTDKQASVLEPANVPGGPFYPNKNMIVGVAFMASLMVGFGLSLLLEFLDSGFRSLSQVEQQTGLPTLGMLPLVGGGKRDQPPHLQATDRQGSLFAESVRTLRTGLMLSSSAVAPKVILVTSSVPSEGKTSTVLSIGCQSTQAGRRCIVIDCDMRHPSVDATLGYAPHIGLGDYLAGEAEIEDVIALDEATGLHFIGAGTGAVRPVELLASPRMEKLLNSLCRRYHMVVLDTPPVLAVSDALPVMRLADATLFLIRWERTNRETAKAALKQVLETGARFAGIALTYVDVRKHAQYDYADSGYYYHKSYRKYYRP